MEIRTEVLRVSPTLPVEELKETVAIQKAARALQQGKLVAFPTETVYGLGADATSTAAIQSIFKAKGRPADNPLILHIGDVGELPSFVSKVSHVSRRLIEVFWPGPLTLIFPYRGGISPQTTAGLPTVAVRIPDHPIALSLLQVLKRPIAAPSANISGSPSPTKASHVYDDLYGRIDTLIDGGSTDIGVETTILDVTREAPLILRPGIVTKEDIEQVIGPVQYASALINKEKPIAPGMKYRHYAPKGEMHLVVGDMENVISYINQESLEWKKKGKRVGVLTTDENRENYAADLILSCGKRSEPYTIGSKLYATLRAFDQGKVDLIFSESFPEKGYTFSIMNRLKKAADGNIVRLA